MGLFFSEDFELPKPYCNPELPLSFLPESFSFLIFVLESCCSLCPWIGFLMKEGRSLKHFRRKRPKALSDAVTQ